MEFNYSGEKWGVRDLFFFEEGSKFTNPATGIEDSLAYGHAPTLDHFEGGVVDYVTDFHFEEFVEEGLVFVDSFVENWEGFTGVVYDPPCLKSSRVKAED